MKKFAMLGAWHVHAPQYARLVNGLEGCTIAKVWGEDDEAAKKWAEELDAEAVSVENILSDPEIQGVIICCATNRHPEMLLRAIESGKAVFTEKVLTLDIADAEKVREAVRARQTVFAISFPHFSEPWTMFALDAARSGKLGDINYVRVRKAHSGSIGDWLPPHFYDEEACGGGAMVDLGAHPIYLTAAFLGVPKAVKSTFTNFTPRPVEDNAVSVLEYESGAIGVAETGFVSNDYPFLIEVGGTKGTLFSRGKEVSYSCEETGHHFVAAALPDAQPSPLEQWAKAEKPEDIPADFDIDAAVRLTRVMAMAYAGK